MDRRTFISATALAPLASVAHAAEKPDTAIVNLVERLETFGSREIICVCWTKAWVASELRKAAGLPEQSGIAKEYADTYLHQYGAFTA